MMDAFIRIIFEKIGVLYLGMIIFITSAVVIFLPQNLQEQLMLQQIRSDYGKFLGPALILSGAYLVVAFIGNFIIFINNWQNRRNHKKRIIEKLENFGHDEMSVLNAFYDIDTKSLRESASLDYFDRRVKLLEAYGIIIRLASNSIASMGWDGNMSCPMPYKLHSLAHKYISEAMWQEMNQKQITP